MSVAPQNWPETAPGKWPASSDRRKRGCGGETTCCESSSRPLSENWPPRSYPSARSHAWSACTATPSTPSSCRDRPGRAPLELRAPVPLIRSRTTCGLAWPSTDLSAVRLFEEIRERGYLGGYTIVKDFVRPLKRYRALAAVVRFVTAPGVQSQVDFGSFGTLDEDGARHRLYGFSMVLGYSRCRYVEFLTHIDTPRLIQCHLNAFDYLGGYSDEILYDNMAQVVLERALRTEDNRWNPLFEDFTRHYGIRTRLCWPYRPETKGKIERTIGFIKSTFFLGRPFTSLGDLNCQAQRWCNSVNAERIRCHDRRGPDHSAR